MRESNRKPTHETSRPSVANPRAPYLSEGQPLIGPNDAIDAEIGMR
jgi:hypothetical protein